MDKELFFFQRTLEHKTRVMMNVLSVVKNSSICERHNVDKVRLIKSVLDHDRTKLREPCLSKYIEISWYYYKKYKGETYPLDKVKSANATILHMVSEPHHPEYWDETFLLSPNKTKISDKDKIPLEPANASRMSHEAIVEMVCDWHAMAQERGNSSAREWADYTVNNRWMFTEEQVKLIYKVIDYLEGQETPVCV